MSSGSTRPFPETKSVGRGDWLQQIAEELHAGAEIRAAMVAACSQEVAAAAQLIVRCYRHGGKVIFFGNGGSAADAQHLAAEFLGRYMLDRRPLPALALTTDTSTLTAISNDYGYQEVFARQVQAWATPRDVIVGISTSGESANVIEALKVARNMGSKTVALVGLTGGSISQTADIVVRVPSSSTARVQEAHITVGHIMCSLVENELFDTKAEV